MCPLNQELFFQKNTKIELNTYALVHILGNPSVAG